MLWKTIATGFVYIVAMYTIIWEDLNGRLTTGELYSYSMWTTICAVAIYAGVIVMHRKHAKR